MTPVETMLGSKLHPLLLERPVWAIKLKDGRFLSEIDIVFRGGNMCPLDWTVDLDDADIRAITELWLLCPPGPHSPVGNTARLPIVEPGTAFQFKNRTLTPGRGSSPSVIIGRVDNKETGGCTCFIWDGMRQGLLTPETVLVNPSTGLSYHPCRTSVYHFGSWGEHIAPIGALSQAVIGLRLA